MDFRAAAGAPAAKNEAGSTQEGTQAAFWKSHVKATLISVRISRG